MIKASTRKYRAFQLPLMVSRASLLLVLSSPLNEVNHLSSFLKIRIDQEEVQQKKGIYKNRKVLVNKGSFPCENIILNLFSVQVFIFNAMCATGCFHVTQKFGIVLFLRSPKIWESAVFTSPESLGMCCFHVPRKSGHVVFSRPPKICACAVFTSPKIWASDVFTSPENLGECRFHVPRKSAHVLF
jgi:hypothetical protein